MGIGWTASTHMVAVVAASPTSASASAGRAGKAAEPPVWCTAWAGQLLKKQ